VGNNEDLTKSALSFFVEQALLGLGNNKSQNNIIKGIKEVFLLTFSSEEIKPILEDLLSKNKIVESSGRYSLEVGRSEELHKQNGEAKEFEKKIFNDWIKLISIKYPELSEDDKGFLVSDLQFYLNKVFLKHGAECSVLIYPEEDPVNNLLKENLVENLEEILPKRDEKINAIRRTEFPLFLGQLDNEKKIYFAKLLDGTFVYNLVQIDPQTQKLVRENFKNYTLYLDTNILYSVFDLQDKNRTTAVDKAINLARSFGMKIVVSQKTVEEMKNSISLKKIDLQNSKPIRRELGDIGANISDEENFVTAYWRAFYKTGISKEDFIAKFEHISDLLASKGIPIEKEVTFKNEALETEKSKLKASLRSVGMGKADKVAEHDSYHKLLIEELRKRAEQKQSPEKYWFLSLDGLLLIYGADTRKQGETPYVLLPHQLLQILRPFTQRTPDYDATFFELFSKPQIKSTQGVLPTNLTQKILAKISGFKELPAEVAIAIILDQSFREKVAKAPDDQAVEKIVDENAEQVMSIKLKEYEDRIKRLELDNAKRNREIEVEKKKDKGEYSKKTKQLNFYKNLAFILAILLFIVANVLFFIYLWSGFTKIKQGFSVLFDVGIFTAILWIRWKLSLSVKISFGVLGVLGFILQVIS
jgi:hypothetical protein